MTRPTNRTSQPFTDQSGKSDLYRILVDRVMDYAIFALDPGGHIITWNTGAEQLKGWKADEIIGRHFSTFYPEEDKRARKPERALEVAAAEGRVEDFGWRLRKDGSRFWANVVITALRDDAGTLVGFAKVTRDLTARRDAEDALRQTEERLRLLVESVRDYALFMLDATGHIATWNPGAQQLKGYSADEIIGKHFSIFYTPEDLAAEKPRRELETVRRTGRYEEEGWRVRKDGTLFWASVVISVVHDAQGGVAGFAKVTRDLTERRAAFNRAMEDTRLLAGVEVARVAAEQHAREQRSLAERLRSQAAELERRSDEAETANRAKSEFLAAMSHELRTPLNAIGGYTQLMAMGLSGPVTDGQRQQLERIQRSQQHLLGIINDILNFSRIEAGRITYDIAPVPIHEVLDAVTPMIAVQAGATGLRLVANVCAPDIVAMGDRSKIEQIVLNLLSNAVKFTPVGGEIGVSCHVVGREVRLAVRDTGMGIPPEQMEQIFAPFVQVGRTLANPKEGAGLGLAISRDLARAMGGDLTAESREGAGSTFVVTLPRA